MTVRRPCCRPCGWASFTSTEVVSTTTKEPRAAKLFRWLSIVIGGALVVMLINWILGDPVERVSTDWTAFDRAGDRVFTDGAVYRSYDEERLPYLYPPFVLWLALPLRFLGFWGSFAFSVALTFLSSMWAYRTLLRMAPASPVNRAVMTGLVFSGTTISATLIGQYSGLWALSLAAGLYFWERDRPELAGVALSLLAFKPNLGIAVLIVLVWSRSWPVLRGYAAAIAAMLVASIPFGTSAWVGFFDNLSSTADVQLRNLANEEKMITVQTAFQTLTELPSRSPAVLAVFAATALVTGVAVLALWTPKALADDRVRAIGGLAMFLVAANPRLYFYDGTLMLVGLLALWATRERWTSDRLRRIATVLAAGLWVGSWGGIFLTLNVIVGPLAAVLVVVWAADARLGIKAATSDVEAAATPGTTNSLAAAA